SAHIGRRVSDWSPMSNGRSDQVPTGEALEKARRRVGFSVEAAAAELSVTVEALGEYESGFRTPADDLIEQMLSLYGVEEGRIVGRPWVPRVAPRYDRETETLWMGWSAITVSPKDNDQIIRSVADALRSMRSSAHDAPLQLRTADLPLLSELLDLGDEELPDILMRYLRLSPSDCLNLVNQMVVVASVRG
ncbi:MAG: helix-turn-helix domain-containing protein, partial [Acidimicrobiales bacterium]